MRGNRKGRDPSKKNYIGAKLGLPLPVSGAMFFDKDVILLLMFACRSYDGIFVALDANAAKRFINATWQRVDENVDDYLIFSYMYLMANFIEFLRSGEIETHVWKFYKRTVAFENTNWYVIEISTRNITSNRKSSKTWVRAKEIRNSTKELLLWRRKSTGR